MAGEVHGCVLEQFLGSDVQTVVVDVNGQPRPHLHLIEHEWDGRGIRVPIRLARTRFYSTQGNLVAGVSFLISRELLNLLLGNGATVELARPLDPRLFTLGKGHDCRRKKKLEKQ